MPFLKISLMRQEIKGKSKAAAVKEIKTVKEQVEKSTSPVQWMMHIARPKGPFPPHILILCTLVFRVLLFINRHKLLLYWYRSADLILISARIVHQSCSLSFSQPADVRNSQRGCSSFWSGHPTSSHLHRCKTKPEVAALIFTDASKSQMKMFNIFFLCCQPQFSTPAIVPQAMANTISNIPTMTLSHHLVCLRFSIFSFACLLLSLSYCQTLLTCEHSLWSMLLWIRAVWYCLSLRLFSRLGSLSCLLAFCHERIPSDQTHQCRDFLL